MAKTAVSIEGDAEEVLTPSSSGEAPSTPAGGDGNGVPPATEADEFSTDEVLGDAVAPAKTGEAVGDEDDFGEVGNGQGSESSMVVATDEQLAATESGEEGAISDLQGIEGFQPPAGEESGEEMPLLDAGAASGLGGDGTAPEFGFLAALAPTLISTVGPPLAKQVVKRLSPRTRNRVRQIAKKAAPVAGGMAAAGFPRGGTAGSVVNLVSSLLTKAESAPEGESAGVVDEELVDQTVGVMEVIIGADDRIRIEATTQVPWRRIAALKISFGTATYRGTGFMIGARTLATAGHCVYLHDRGWATSIEVNPGANGGERPFGSVTATSFRSIRGWVSGRKPEADIGCILLPGPIGQNVGSFGFAAFKPKNLLGKSAVLAGYDGDKPFAELWGMANSIGAVGPKTLTYGHDTYGGKSGAPLYIKRDGQRYVVGIHNYGAASGNSATRITKPVYDRLLAWSRL